MYVVYMVSQKGIFDICSCNLSVHLEILFETQCINAYLFCLHLLRCIQLVQPNQNWFGSPTVYCIQLCEANQFLKLSVPIILSLKACFRTVLFVTCGFI